jgi:DNA-binding PadR family transcriptional regulator
VFALKSELECSIRERVLKALLDLVIIRLLSQHPMSGYEINKAITKQTQVILNPSTIYSKLYILERKEKVRYVMGRSGKVYSLTEQGQQTMSDMPITVEEICGSAHILLTKQNSAHKKKTSGSMTLWEQHILLKLLQKENEFPTSHT